MIFFFSIEHDAVTHYRAYLEIFWVQDDRMVQSRLSTAIKMVIEASSNHKHSGLIKNSGREYLVHRDACLLSGTRITDG